MRTAGEAAPQGRAEALFTLGVFTALALAALGGIVDPAISRRAGSAILVQLALFGLVFLWVRSPWLRAYAAWSLVGVFLVPHPDVRNAFAILLTWLVALEVIAQRAWTEAHLTSLLTGWRWLALLQAGMALLQHAGVLLIYHQVNPAVHLDPGGFFDNSTLGAAFLAISAPLFLRGRWRFGLPMLAAGLCVSGSVGALVAAAVAVAVASRRMLGRARWAVLAATVAVLVGYSVMSGEAIAGKVQSELTNPLSRVAVWRQDLAIITRTPQTLLTGYGLGQHATVWRAWITARKVDERLYWNAAHNAPIQLTVEQGLIGLALITGFVLTLVVAYWRMTDAFSLTMTGMLAGWLTAGLYSFPDRHAPLALTGLVLFGLLEYGRRRAAAQRHTARDWQVAHDVGRMVMAP